MKYPLFLFLLYIAMSPPAWGVTDTQNSKVLAKMEMFNVGNYDSIYVSHNIKVVLYPAIRESETRMIAVKADSESIKKLSIKVVERTLFLKLNSFVYAKSAKIICFVSNLKSIHATEAASVIMDEDAWYKPFNPPVLNIQAHGSSKISLHSLDIEYLNLFARDSSSVLLAGFTSNLIASVGAHVNLDLSYLNAEHAEITIPGVSIYQADLELDDNSSD